MPTCFVRQLPYRTNPAVYFSLVRNAPGAVLLDSGRPEAVRGRFDIISAWPLMELTPGKDESAQHFITRLRSSLSMLGVAELPMELPFAGGLIGYLSYDFGRHVEVSPAGSKDDLHLPVALLGLYPWALITDHQLNTSQLMFHPALAPAECERLYQLFTSIDLPPQSDTFTLLGQFEADVNASRYADAIFRVHDYIRAGDCYQVNFSQRFRCGYQGDPWIAYTALRAKCPTPFAAYLTLRSGGAVMSLSPERFVKVADGMVETRPIKGTRPRGLSDEEDAANAEELLSSPKDRSENLMIVDLLRNDLGRSCRVGTVRVPELFKLESYPNVHHLVSAVTGELADSKDALDLLFGAFPGGSITGAPKVRAMEIIDELEPTRRSIYCGSLMYLDVRGEMDSSIAIRTLLAKDGIINCWGGGGIVADSEWKAEYQESITKVQVLMRTLESFRKP
ncbi:aminodeoxychorismate synthase component I [Pseudomonas fluorescens]|uniref:aminodeoxychorismate synthase component I n=1 Tax=Pseudomonas fluorescens TaxID=294 RepID=UPI0037F9E9CD